MAKKNKVRIYNRLFFKLYRNYAVMLLVTAIMICLIFMSLYNKTTIKNHTKQLQDKAKKVSEWMSLDYINEENQKNFLSDLLWESKFNNIDIWTVSNPYASNPMSSKMETCSFEEFKSKELGDYINILERAFQNLDNNVQIEDDKIVQVPTITVSVPIYGKTREVVGAVLIKSYVSEQKEIVNNGVCLMLYSSAIALAISFIIVILFTTGLSIPISRMRVTSLELADGNYHSKTGIKRKDEIGDLAKTIDILSEKLLENDIQRKNLEQTRMDFFANVSHELRTPITVVRAYTETLVDGVVKDEDKINQYYNRMLAECKSMERLVGDLLLLSKMQNPDFTIEKEPVNLMQVFEDIFRSASTIAEKKNITIDVKKDCPIYMILGDYDRLRQMFMVILDNAIKFSDQNKTVYINLSRTDKVIVSIRDEGVGISQSDIENIFKKFYKSSLRENASGSGLGLAIARQIALKHSGDIEVKSEVGVGSEFIFYLPPYDGKW
jgi:signal transduction histidine kinase